MTMDPLEAQNVMNMAANINSLNAKVAMLEGQVAALVDTLNSMARHWSRGQGSIQQGAGIANAEQMGGGMGGPRF